ncbi:MAG: hypothetical protein K6G55_04320 [Selenomonadaceae bacterium]|nr:hypothetical protein [Selenomonadaceae bacterium]
MKKNFLTTFMTVMLITVTAFANGWQQIYTDDSNNQIYFNPDSVQVTARDNDSATFSASFRMIYSNKGRDILIDWYRNNSVMPRDIESLAYDVAKINFRKDGDERYYCIESRISYRADGSEIKDMHYIAEENPTWQPIQIGSVLDVEYYNAILIVEGKEFDIQ